MTYNVDIDYYVKQCTDLEREIDEGLNQVQDTDGAERRNLIKELKTKVARARDYVTTIQMEALDISDEDDHEKYNDEYEKHNDEITKLEEQVKSVGKAAQAQEKARASGLTTQDVMDKALDLQEIQKNKLDNSIITINNINEVGNETLNEIDRQKKVLEEAQNNMVEMDSELSRAKKIMKQMVNRAAGDNCVRILALLFLLAVLAVIIVECVKPGAVKKQINGWFSSESES